MKIEQEVVIILNIIKSILKYAARIACRVPINYVTVEVKELSPSEQLKDRNIFITGGGRGLGYYMAKNVFHKGQMCCVDCWAK